MTELSWSRKGPNKKTVWGLSLLTKLMKSLNDSYDKLSLEVKGPDPIMIYIAFECVNYLQC
jgi:hypothetical protein